MTAQTVSAGVLALLESTPLLVLDGTPPTVTPTRVYACVYGDTGVASPVTYEQLSRRVSFAVRVVVAAVDAAGVRFGVDHVRAALTDRSPVVSAGAGRLREVSSGPLLWDGPEGDRRASMTLTYRVTIPRSYPS